MFANREDPSSPWHGYAVLSPWGLVQVPLAGLRVPGGLCSLDDLGHDGPFRPRISLPLSTSLTASPFLLAKGPVQVTLRAQLRFRHVPLHPQLTLLPGVDAGGMRAV